MRKVGAFLFEANYSLIFFVYFKWSGFMKGYPIEALDWKEEVHSKQGNLHLSALKFSKYSYLPLSTVKELRGD